MDQEEQMPRKEGTGGDISRASTSQGGRVGDRCLSEVRKGIREGSQIGARVG